MMSLTILDGYAVLTVAGLSDWLDGYIARTYKQEVRASLRRCGWTPIG